MKSINNVILDQPIVTPYTLVADGYINISMYWPEDNSRSRTFWPTEMLATKTFRFSATGYDIKFRILGSLDGSLTFTETVVPETTLVVGTPYSISIVDYYTALRIQVATSVSVQFGTFSASLSGTSLTGSTIRFASQLPIGATPVMGTANGAAGAAVTASVPIASGKINYVLGYSVVVDTAALTNGITVTLKDDTTTKSIIDALPALAPVGTKANMCSSVPIMASTVSKAANLVVSASTGTSIVHATIWGYTL